MFIKKMELIKNPILKAYKNGESTFYIFVIYFKLL